MDAEKLVRAWRNRFISERMNAYPNDSYEVRRAKAESDANDFESAFIAEMERRALTPSEAEVDVAAKAMAMGGWDVLDEHVQARYRDMARAAIQALRGKA